MTRPRASWFLLLCLTLALAACNTTPDPTLMRSAHADRGYSGRVWFLPPVGSPKPHDRFDDDLDLTIAVFNVDPDTGIAVGPALPPSLASSDGSIDRSAGGYKAKWRVSRTASAAAGEFVRLEIRRAGAPEGPACNAPNRDCLGFLDVRLVPNKGKRASAGTPAGFLPVVSKRTLPLKFMVRSLDGTVPDTLSGLTSVGSDAPLKESLGNCASGEFDTPSQGLRAVGAGLRAVGAGLRAIGAVGGLFAGPSEAFVDRTVTTDELAAGLVDAIGFDPDRKVAILVVDDFHGVYHLPGELELDVPDADIDLEELFTEGKLSHGALVFHQVLDLVDALSEGDRADGQNASTHEPLATFEPDEDHHEPMLVQAVDTDGLDTDHMADRIRQSLDYITGELGYQLVVVNMSFAVVPCAVQEDFGLSGVDTFEQYVTALGLVNDIPEAAEGELKLLVSTPVALEDEALFAYLACPMATEGSASCDGSSDPDGPVVKAMVHVAASGNYGLDFPMYPAALPTVIAVGSQDVTASGFSTQRSDFSNVANVLAPGALIELKSANETTVAYAGTSFSAPIVSVFEAMDLAHHDPDPICDPGILSGTTVTAPALASGAYQDTPLLPLVVDGPSPAVDAYCTP